MDINPYNSSTYPPHNGAAQSSKTSCARSPFDPPPSRTSTIIMGVGIWQLVWIISWLIYSSSLVYLVTTGYTAIYGDVQASYGRFDRVSIYIALSVTTLPACALTLAWYHRYTGRPVNRMKTAIVLGCWQLFVLGLLVWSYEVGLPYRISQLRWRLLGPPAEIYSFSNMVLPRIIAWLLCTVPVSWGALWVYSRRQEIRDRSEAIAGMPGKQRQMT
ncbi:MAG: hypothetical protein U0795_00560 [Pirellulales bacterium]